MRREKNDRKRKLDYIDTLDGCRYDILEPGGDADLARAKKRIGDRVCMIAALKC